MKQISVHSVLVPALWLAATVAAAEPSASDMALWRDPAFQKQFMGSYGFKADIEPRVTTVENDLMQKVLTLMGDPDGMDKARELLERTIRPANSAVFDFTLGNIHFQTGALDQATEWYEKAIEKFPSFQRAYKNLGLVHVQGSRFKQALEPLTRAIELGDGDGLTFGLLGFALLMSEQFTSAESAYRQAMMLQPDSVDWKLGLARCLFKQSRYEEAVTLCRQLIAEDPANPDFWLLQANAYLGMKQPLRAAQNYEYLDAVGEGSEESMTRLGDIYANEGLMDLAADAYGRAMAHNPEGRPAAFIRNAEVLGARAAYPEAALLLERIRSVFGDKLLDEERKRVLKLEARLATAQGAAVAEQIRLLEAIVTLDPLDGEALILLGRHYASDDQLEKAAFMFERAAGLAEFEAQAKLRHAQCLVRFERFQDAIPLLKQALELEPRDDVARYLEQVERVARLRN